MDLRAWVVTDHASALGRFDQAIAPHVPTERWKERPGGGGASIAWLLFHLSYHQDLAIAAAVRGRPPVLVEWRDRLGLSGAEPHDGLGEAEQPEVTEALLLDEIAAYARSVQSATSTWLTTVDLAALDGATDASSHLEDQGVTASAVPWLHRMWDAKPVGWFVRWEAIGHVHGHVGEMVSVRSRLGLTPF